MGLKELRWGIGLSPAGDRNEGRIVEGLRDWGPGSLLWGDRLAQWSSLGGTTGGPMAQCETKYVSVLRVRFSVRVV